MLLSVPGEVGQGFNTGDGSNGKHCFMCSLRATKRKENNSLSKKEPSCQYKNGNYYSVYKLKDPL